MKRVLLTLALLGVIAASFGAGFLVARQRYRDTEPVPTREPEPEPSTSAIMPENYTPALFVRTEAEVEQARAGLLELFYGAPELPPTLPEGQGDDLLLNMPYGLTSHIKLYPGDNGRFLIYHVGHHEEPTDREAVAFFHEQGYTVARLYMPVRDENGPVTVDLPRVGPVTLRNHNHMMYLPDPMRYFVEPITAVVNLAEAQGYEDITMVGLSGGGWATTVYSAIDTRIDRSYPAAGSLPMAFRYVEAKDWGDLEQMYPPMLAIATYEDLYVMGAANRAQIQILNKFDSCCYADGDDRHALYEPAITEAAAGLNGHFEVWVDDSHREHLLTPAMLTRIVDDIQARVGAG